MPATVISTLDGDVIDQIVHNHYGYVDGALEMVMAANEHLWLQPDRMPAGVEITLPEHVNADEGRMVRLWDS